MKIIKKYYIIKIPDVPNVSGCSLMEFSTNSKAASIASAISRFCLRLAAANVVSFNMVLPILLLFEPEILPFSFVPLYLVKLILIKFDARGKQKKSIHNILEIYLELQVKRLTAGVHLY